MEERKIAEVKPEVEELGDTFSEVIRRLDDGNNVPGFKLKKEENKYILYYVE